MKKIFVVCASSVATSTILRIKIERYFEEKSIPVKVTQYRVTELSVDRLDADVIVATTEIPEEIRNKIPVINGIALITGIGQKEVLADIEQKLLKDRSNNG